MVSAGTESRMASWGSGTPGVLFDPEVLGSRPHAEASITTAAAATSVFLARDIPGTLSGGVYPAARAKRALLLYDVCRTAEVPPGGRLAARPGCRNWQTMWP